MLVALIGVVVEAMGAGVPLTMGLLLVAVGLVHVTVGLVVVGRGDTGDRLSSWMA